MAPFRPMCSEPRISVFDGTESVVAPGFLAVGQRVPYAGREFASRSSKPGLRRSDHPSLAEAQYLAAVGAEKHDVVTLDERRTL